MNDDIKVKRTTGGRYEVFLKARYVGEVYRDYRLVPVYNRPLTKVLRHSSSPIWFWTQEPGGFKSRAAECEPTRKDAISSLLAEAFK